MSRYLAAACLLGMIPAAQGATVTVNSTGTSSINWEQTQVTVILPISRTIGGASTSPTTQNWGPQDNFTFSGTGSTIDLNSGGLLNQTSIDAGVLTFGSDGFVVSSANGTTLSTTGVNVTNAGHTATISAVIGSSGAGNLVKSGLGNLVLSGANSYNGGTRIDAGTLTAGHASSLGSGSVNINGGALLTSVTNVNVGALTMSSGVLNINGTSSGTVTLASGADLVMNGGTWQLDLASSTDSIKGTGPGATFTLTGATLDLGGGAIDYGRSYDLIAGFNSGSVSNLSFTNYDTANWTASLSNLGVLSFTAVPEPSTYGLIGAGALAAIAFVRRRRNTCAI